jgi:hypothetical protein
MTSQYDKAGLNQGCSTYNLAIQEVLLDHDNVDAFGVLESEETKAARSTSCAITHNGTFCHFSKLSEVVS